MIRFDGLYQSEEEGFFQYLRFYADGSLLTVNTDGEPDQVFNLMDKNHPRVSTGSYTLSGSEIAFTASSAEGAVDYHGQADEKGLVLQVFRHINGHQDEERYTFVAVFPALFEGELVFLRVRCTDALRFGDGNFSDVQEWVFYLRAPSGWAYAPALRERVSRLAVRLYEGLNWHSGLRPSQDDGSRYVLGDVEATILGPQESRLRPWRGKPCYDLQPGESVKMLQGV
jgi:hypothetical protein